jgi:hypothetical protein
VRDLVGLGRAGVAGRLRVGYLQRRVAWMSNGEVVFEASLPEEGADSDAVPRLVTLSQMRTLISAWRVKRGYSSDRPSVLPACGPKGIPAIRQQNAGSGRAGGLVPANVTLLDDVQWTLPEWARPRQGHHEDSERGIIQHQAGGSIPGTPVFSGLRDRRG